MKPPKRDNNRFALLRQLSLRDVASRLGIESSTKAIRCPLPDHEDQNPSFAFFFSTNTWKCFGCGRGGTTIDLVIGMLGCSVGDAAAWLEGAASRFPEIANQKPDSKTERPSSAEEFSPDHEVYSALLATSPMIRSAREYLQKREISDATIAHFELAFLGNADAALDRLIRQFSRERLHRAGLTASVQSTRLALPSNSIVFPFLRAGKVEYLQSRLMPGAVGPRWIGLAGIRKPIFNSDVLRKASTIYVCEGATDVLSAHELNLSAIGLLGAATRVPRDVLRSLIMKTVFVVPDDDSAGENMLRCFAEDLRSAGGVALEKRVPEGSDLNDYLVLKRGKMRGSGKGVNHES